MAIRRQKTIISALVTLLFAAVLGDECQDVILKETIGSGSNPYAEGAVQIIDSENDMVTFTLNQLWNSDGIPMMSISYPGGHEGATVCESAQDTLLEYNASEEYTAQCFHGYAEVSVYLYVGDPADVIFEECETCSAPNSNYVGYYLTLPCCETITTSEPRPVCENAASVVKTIGETAFPNGSVVTVGAQNTTHVTTSLVQGWEGDAASGTVVDHIFVSYRTSVFGQHCFEYTNISYGTIFAEDLIMTCNGLSKFAWLEICVVDDINKGTLVEGDNAEVPKCCHPDFAEDTPVVCYVLEVSCDVCPDEAEQRKLSSPTATTRWLRR